MMKPTLYPLLAAALAVLSLAGCVDRAAQAQAKRTGEIATDPSIPVEVALPVVGSMKDTLTVTGNIVAGQDAYLGSKVAGRVVAVHVRDGDRVSAGQTIAQLETSDALARVRQAQAGIQVGQSQLNQALEEARVGPAKSAAGVRAARARLEQQRELVKKLRAGARPEERRQLDAAVQAAKTNLEKQKADMERFRNLYSQGAASRQDLDRAENAYAQSLSQYEQAIQSLRMASNGARTEDVAAALQQFRASEEDLKTAIEQQRLDIQYQYRVSGARANLDQAREQLTLARQAYDDTLIRAPFSGSISGKPLQVGTFAGPGTPVARIVGGGGLYFEAEIPETELSKVVTGSEVVIESTALVGKLYSGRVIAVNPQGSEVGRLFKARVELNAPDGLKSGIFAKGTITLRTVPDAMTVPSSAILKEGQRQFVYVAAGAKAKKVEVKTGLSERNRTQVLGLNGDSRVVVRGQGRLVEGAKIKIRDGSKKAQRGFHLWA